MISPDWLRAVILIMSASVAAFALVRSRARYGSKKWALYTMAAYAAAAFWSQLSLLGTDTPVTSRTVVNLAASTVGIGYIVVTSRKKE